MLRSPFGPGLCACALLLVACGIDDFEVTISDQATISGTFGSGIPTGLPYEGGFESLSLAQSQEFQNNDVSPGDVDAIFVRSVVLEGTDPRVDNLNALLERVELFIEAPGQTRTSIAQQNTFPSGSRVELEIDDTLNLKPYATAPSMKVSAEVTLKRRPTFSTTLRTTVTMLVDINLIGL